MLEETCPPILVLAFNRPDTTRAVFDSLRAIRPTKLFFSVDGARAGRAGEEDKISQVRKLATQVDWPCQIKTLFQEHNLGCKFAVSNAISWFFDHVDAGIILEDDCVAHPSFFEFTRELLDRFRDDQRVTMISGDNFQFGRRRNEYSYYFSRHTHIWGWATWRRAWQLYDHRMTVWPRLRENGWLQDILQDKRAVEYWTRIFDETHAEKNSSWAYRWTFASWVQSGLVILPSTNLVSNIGFGDQATHTKGAGSPLASLPISDIGFPLSHPPFVIRDDRADQFTQDSIFAGESLVQRVIGAVKRRIMRR